MKCRIGVPFGAAHMTAPGPTRKLPWPSWASGYCGEPAGFAEPVRNAGWPAAHVGDRFERDGEPGEHRSVRKPF